MALSNSERVERHRQKLKAKAKVADQTLPVLFGLIETLSGRVDLLTDNMIGLQKALLLTNEKIADMERRNSPLIDINGRAMRKN
jgi:hypothetical protein